jgi:hypothetical protein
MIENHLCTFFGTLVGNICQLSQLWCAKIMEMPRGIHFNGAEFCIFFSRLMMALKKITPILANLKFQLDGWFISKGKVQKK